jgi:hypothetical protein
VAALARSTVPQATADVALPGTEPSQIGAVGLAGELAQEPVDRVDVIGPFPPRLERGVRDQRPSRLAGVEFRRDTAKQIVDLDRAVTPSGPAPERRAPDLLAVHRSRITPLRPSSG